MILLGLLETGGVGSSSGGVTVIVGNPATAAV